MIKDLYRKGVSISEIARRTARDRKTIRHMITALLAVPASAHRKPRPHKIDPYVPYLKQQIDGGMLNARIMRDSLRNFIGVERLTAP